MDNAEMPEAVEEEMLAAILQQAKCGVTMEVHDLLGMGVTVDNDNEPVPKNIPTQMVTLFYMLSLILTVALK